MTVSYYSSVQDVATVDSGPAFKSSQFGEIDEGIPLLRGENIEPGALRWTKTRTWPESLLPGYESLLVEDGDLILGMDRPVISTGLKLAVVRPADVPALLVQRVARIRPKSIDGRYLHLWLSSEDFIQHLQGSATGTQLPHVNLASIREFQVPRFGEDAERRIVDLLEDHLSRLDAADRETQRAVDRLALLRHAVWTGAFDTLNASMVPLLEVATIANGQTPKGLVDRLSSEPAPPSVPFYKVGDMNASEGRWMSATRSYVTLKDIAELGLHVRPTGTVLIPKRGGAIATNKKRILASPASFDLNTMGLVPSDRVNSTYLWHWLQGIDLAKLADGSNVPQINAPHIRRLSLPLPSIPIQVSLVDRLDDTEEALVRLELAAEQALNKSASLRRALLAAAFSGRLTDNASDESAAEEMMNA